MMKKLQLSKQNTFVLCIFLVTVFFACMPLMTENCINGHDIEYHLLRIEALKEGILAGKPFLKINMLFFGGQGYASSLFYPDFLLYIPAVLRALGVGINASYHIFIAFCIAASYGTSFFFTKKITGSVYSASAAAVILTLSQYHLDDIYTRSAVGEYTAFIFLPLVVYGLYELANARIEHPVVMGAGLAGVLLCHTSTAVFCVGLYAFVFVLSIPKYVKEKEAMLRLVVTGVSVILLTSFYWLPVLEQLSSAGFQVGGNYFNLANEMLQVKEIFGRQIPGMGMTVFIFLLPGLFVRREKQGIVRFADLCAFTGILFSLGATTLFPWERVQKLLGFVQFPWRLFIMATVLFSTAAAVYTEEFVKSVMSEVQPFHGKHIKIWQTHLGQIAFLMLLGAMIVSAAGNLERNEEGYYSYSNDYYSHAPFTANVIGGEWLPVGVTDRDALVRDASTAKDDLGSTYKVERVKNEMYVRDIDLDASYADVPYIYYKGYRAENQSGQELEINGSGENGQCRVMLSGADSIHVFYAGTALQKGSLAVSVILSAALLVVFYYRRRQDSGKEAGIDGTADGRKEL